MQVSGQYKSALCREAKQLCALGHLAGACLQRTRGSGDEGEGGLSSGRHVGDVLLREDTVLVSAGVRRDTSHEG